MKDGSPIFQLGYLNYLQLLRRHMRETGKEGVITEQKHRGELGGRDGRLRRI